MCSDRDISDLFNTVAGIALLATFLSLHSCDRIVDQASSTPPLPGEVIFPIGSHTSVNLLRKVGTDSLAIGYRYDHEITVYDAQIILDLKSGIQHPFPKAGGLYWEDLQNGVSLFRSSLTNMEAHSGGVRLCTIPYGYNVRLNEFGTGLTYFSGDTLFALTFGIPQPNVLYVADSLHYLWRHLWRANKVYFTVSSRINEYQNPSTDLYSIAVSGGSPTRLTNGEQIIVAIAVSGDLVAFQGVTAHWQSMHVTVLENGSVVYKRDHWFTGLEIVGDTLYYSGGSVFKYGWR